MLLICSLAEAFFIENGEFHFNASFPNHSSLGDSQGSNTVSMTYLGMSWFSHVLVLTDWLCLTFRAREVDFEAQTSRYLNEFEELAVLGKGGYGRVYKVVFYIFILTSTLNNVLYLKMFSLPFKVLKGNFQKLYIFFY